MRMMRAVMTEEFRITKEVYLGDAVFASFDGWHIWLRTGDGNNQRIALEPEVFAKLVQYKNELYSQQREKKS